MQMLSSFCWNPGAFRKKNKTPELKRSRYYEVGEIVKIFINIETSYFNDMLCFVK